MAWGKEEGFVVGQKKPSPCFCYPIHGHWS